MNSMGGSSLRRTGASATGEMARWWRQGLIQVGEAEWVLRGDCLFMEQYKNNLKIYNIASS